MVHVLRQSTGFGGFIFIENNRAGKKEKRQKFFLGSAGMNPPHVLPGGLFAGLKKI